MSEKLITSIEKTVQNSIKAIIPKQGNFIFMLYAVIVGIMLTGIILYYGSQSENIYLKKFFNRATFGYQNIGKE